MSKVLELEDVIRESFTQYAGAVIQSRALVDVRDCIKPSARQVYYSLFTDKFTSDKPFKRPLKRLALPCASIFMETLRVKVLLCAAGSLSLCVIP